MIPPTRVTYNRLQKAYYKITPKRGCRMQQQKQMEDEQERDIHSFSLAASTKENERILYQEYTNRMSPKKRSLLLPWTVPR